MTSKERWLAALQFQPFDRFPFWPKLNGAYPRMQEPPFCNMSNDELHKWIGSDPQMGIPGCVREVREHSSRESSREGDTQRVLYKTRSGELELINRFDRDSQSWHPVKFPVENVEQIRIMTEFYTDVKVELDTQALAVARKRTEEIGQDAIIANSIGTSPIMEWVQWIAGVENAHFLLWDSPDEVEELFEIMFRTLRKRAEILSEHSPCDILYLVENTSTTLISPEQYRKYSYPHVKECAEIVDQAGRILVLHMCGHLKAILPELSTLKARAFEAFTSPPVGNTTLLDGRTGCPDKCLIGGTNAALWTRPGEFIINEIEQDLDELPHHHGLVITSAGVMPPICDPETIRNVCQRVQEYTPKFDALTGAGAL